MNPGAAEAPKFEQFLDCVHCGFCLPACPTFVVLGTEMDSPRGRIHLMRSLAEGEVTETDTYRDHLETCLVCRSCETACPSGVQFGDMMEAARSQLQLDSPRWLRAIALSILPHPRILRSIALLLRVAQRLRLTTAYDNIVRPRTLSPSLLPIIPPPSVRAGYDVEVVPALGVRTMRVGFLRGCVADVLFSRVNQSTINVLTHNGCEVVMPRTQTCCGSLFAHNGLRDEARKLAQRNIDAFLASEVDTIISNAAGCGATMKEYHALLKNDPVYAERAVLFERSVRDISEFLADITLAPFTHEVPATVAYHDACHLAHGQQIREAPRALLRGIPGLSVVELHDGEMCCGSAGIYNVVQPEIATELQSRKINHIRKTGATIVAAANPGCVMQIAAGAKREGLELRVAHPIELIAEGYGYVVSD